MGERRGWGWLDSGRVGGQRWSWGVGIGGRELLIHRGRWRDRRVGRCFSGVRRANDVVDSQPRPVAHFHGRDRPFRATQLPTAPLSSQAAVAAAARTSPRDGRGHEGSHRDGIASGEARDGRDGRARLLMARRSAISSSSIASLIESCKQGAGRFIDDNGDVPKPERAS
jgi:hypothetical protein